MSDKGLVFYTSRTNREAERALVLAKFPSNRSCLVEVLMRDNRESTKAHVDVRHSKHYAPENVCPPP